MTQGRRNSRRVKTLFCHAIAEGDRIVTVLDGLDALKIREGQPAWPGDDCRLIRVRVEYLGEEERKER